MQWMGVDALEFDSGLGLVGGSARVNGMGESGKVNPGPISASIIDDGVENGEGWEKPHDDESDIRLAGELALPECRGVDGMGSD